MSTSDVPRTPTGNTLQLALATGGFAICFAVFGSVSAMMPLLKKNLALDPFQVSVALAIPVLLGSVGRVPLGVLTDRYGPRLVFSAVLAASAVPAFLMGWVSSYGQLVACGFAIGIALASFAVGAPLASGWYPKERQGAALGIYGAGNIGQSLAAFGSPVIAAALGYVWGFWIFGVLTLGWLAFYLAKAENPPRTGPPKSVRENLAPLGEAKSWLLSLFYFLTFGGFVAMSVYLPTFLTEMFGLTPSDAGMRTAGFVVLATVMRPIGGALADRIGGRAILKLVFPAVAAMALLMAVPAMATFTVGALGMAAAIGLGNGAVFKLVPEYFPTSVASVTGLVGAAGGLGGFFPPLLLGVVRQQTGEFTLGFVALAGFAILCLAVLARAGSGAPKANRSLEPA
jgi:NNP family nitrate/nitrite transporter-like MFS transporter